MEILMRGRGFMAVESERNIAAATCFANGGAGVIERSIGLSGSSVSGSMAYSLTRCVESRVNLSPAKETGSWFQVSYQSQISSRHVSSDLRRGIGVLLSTSWKGSRVAILPFLGTTAGVGSLIGPWM
jgi:hypothetical protein